MTFVSTSPMPTEEPGISTKGIGLRSFSLHSHPPDDICGREEQDKESSTAVASQDASSHNVEENLDSLIAELEAEDGKEPDPEESATGTVTERHTDPNLLLTDPDQGLTETEVLTARRKYGWNRMKEERQSSWVKFFKMFVGPVQFVMEVSTRSHLPINAVVWTAKTEYS